MDSTENPRHSSPPSTVVREVSKITPQFYDSLGATYEAMYGQNPFLLDFLQRLVPRLPAHAHVLDVGCGTGRPVATTLAAAGHRVLGIDMSEEMVRLSRQAVPSGTFELADMRTYQPPSDMQPDAILAILALFALKRDDIEAQIAKWSKLLRPDGLLCIGSTPAESLDVEARQGAYDADGYAARDIKVEFMGTVRPITLFTRDGWKHLLEANGLKIVDVVNGDFVPPAEARSDDETHHYIMAKKVR